MNLLFWSAIGFGLGVVFASFFEWALHRWFMHKPWPMFDYPFRTHALIHHHVFKADHSYHDVEGKHKDIIPMAWWNGPVLVLLCEIPFFPVAWFTGHWGLCLGSAVAFGAYYATYEYLHWCMHLPRKRGIERSGIFFRLNGHHILHHRYMHKNFNVVLPLADLLCGTLLLRSKIAFPQVRGHAVPDLQPLTERRRWWNSAGRFFVQVFAGVRHD